MIPDTPPSHPFERALWRLRRFLRLRELNAPDEIIERERELALEVWANAACLEEAAQFAWPSELTPVAEELGMLGGAAFGEIPGALRALGSSPSELSPSDPAAIVQLAAGYEMTDYAGIFAGSGRFLAGELPGATIVRPPLKVSCVGELFNLSGRLCTFDVMDSAFLDRTVQDLDRTVPTGTHDVYVAEFEDKIAAAVVLFDEGDVRYWAPARPNADNTPMQAPPWIPMSMVRFSIALCDRGHFDKLMDMPRLQRDIEKINAFRAESGDPPVGPEDPLSIAIRTGVPPTFQVIRKFFEDGTRHTKVSDVIAMRTDMPVASHWGLDEWGNVVAYAMDFGDLRLFPSDGRGNTTGVSRAAVLLETGSLARRLARRGAEASLEDHARRLVGLITGWRDAAATSRLVRELERLG